MSAAPASPAATATTTPVAPAASAAPASDKKKSKPAKKTEAQPPAPAAAAAVDAPAPAADSAAAPAPAAKPKTRKRTSKPKAGSSAEAAPAGAASATPAAKAQPSTPAIKAYVSSTDRSALTREQLQSLLPGATKVEFPKSKRNEANRHTSAFVVFDSEDSLSKAIEASPIKSDGKEIVVERKSESGNDLVSLYVGTQDVAPVEESTRAKIYELFAKAEGFKYVCVPPAGRTFYLVRFRTAEAADKAAATKVVLADKELPVVRTLVARSKPARAEAKPKAPKAPRVLVYITNADEAATQETLTQALKALPGFVAVKGRKAPWAAAFASATEAAAAAASTNLVCGDVTLALTLEKPAAPAKPKQAPKPAAAAAPKAAKPEGAVHLGIGSAFVGEKELEAFFAPLEGFVRFQRVKPEPDSVVYIALFATKEQAAAVAAAHPTLTLAGVVLEPSLEDITRRQSATLKESLASPDGRIDPHSSLLLMGYNGKAFSFKELVEFVVAKLGEDVVRVSVSPRRSTGRAMLEFVSKEAADKAFPTKLSLKGVEMTFSRPYVQDLDHWIVLKSLPRSAIETQALIKLIAEATGVAVEIKRGKTIKNSFVFAHCASAADANTVIKAASEGKLVVKSTKLTAAPRSLPNARAPATAETAA